MCMVKASIGPFIQHRLGLGWVRAPDMCGKKHPSLLTMDLGTRVAASMQSLLCTEGLLCMRCSAVALSTG